MRSVEQIEAALHVFREWPQVAKELQHLLAVGCVVVPLSADVDVVGLHVEDELILGPFFLEGLLVFDFGRAYVIAIAEHLVQGQQCGGGAAAGAQEVAAAQPLAPGRIFADVNQAGFVFFLLRRLRRRNEFFVRRDPRRNRQRCLSLGVKLALAYPHGGSPACRISSPFSQSLAATRQGSAEWKLCCPRSPRGSRLNFALKRNISGLPVRNKRSPA